MRILIVDDNPVYRLSLSQMLLSLMPQMNVVHAENIKTACMVLQDELPQLIFIDIKLGDENGLHLVRDVRKRFSSVTVAVMTNLNLPEYRHAAYEAGAHYFIPKGAACGMDIAMLVNTLNCDASLKWPLGSEYINPKGL